MATPEARLPEASHRALLEHAARHVASELRGGVRPAAPLAREHPLLFAPGEVFATWRHAPSGELRGCIGTMNHHGISLLCNSERMAIAAARDDPRFSPIEPDQLDDLLLSLTVLGPRRPWAAPRDPRRVRIGEEGVHVHRGRQRGVLLPQVAAEWGYDGEQFLEATCRKAGLPAAAWRDAEVEVLLFSAVERGAPFVELTGGPRA